MRILFTIMITLAISAQAFAQTSEAERENGQLLIQLNQGNKEQLLSGLLTEFGQAGLSVEKQLSQRLNIWLLGFNESAVNSEKLLNDVRLHSSVKLAQFNHKVTERELIPDDPSFSSQWALKNTGQMSGLPGADIEASYAWDITTNGVTAGGDTIVIAMVDGGIDLGHRDLKLWKNRLEIPYNSIDDDNNGYIDDYNGWNAYGNNGNVSQSDHGTHVAGISAARGNNGLGVTGVAFNTYLMPISGSGSNEAIAVIAYDYIFTMRKIYNETEGSAGAFVVVTNSSFGIDGANPANYPLWGAIYDSLGSVGILNVSSTANRAWDVDINGDIPTAMTNESIVAVTNTTNTDALNTQAAWGVHSVDLGAPGTNIYSTRPGDAYGYKSGTSMSSPHVSGAIALMYAAADASAIQQYKNDPVLVSSRFKRYLIATVDSIPGLIGKTVSGGRLNLLNALQMVQNPPAITAEPGMISLYTAAETITNIDIQLTATACETDSFYVSIPETTPWLTVGTTAGMLIGNQPETLSVTINPNNLADDNYFSTITIRDFFLNELIIPVEVKVRTGVNTGQLRNDKSRLSVAPNPVTKGSRISFSMETAGKVSLELFDLTGRRKEILLSAVTNPGNHSLNWSPDLNPGIYLLKLTTGDRTEALKIVVP